MARPLVTFGVGGIGEYASVGMEGSIVVDTPTPTAIARKISELLKQPAEAVQQIGRKNRIKVKSLSAVNMAAEYSSLYLRLAAEASGRVK